MVLRITTWNVNGIRNPFGYQPWRDRRTFDGMFDILEADIVIMQELKIQRKDLTDDMVLVPGWDCYFSLPKHKKGYSGVGIYTRNSVCAPIRAEEGVLGVLCPPGSSIPYCDLPSDKHIGGYLSEDQLERLGVDAAALDAEGRCVVVEFPAFVLFGIYSPANSSGTRDDFRYGFINAMDTRIRNLIAEGKRVIVTGDLNVSRNEMDTAGAADNMRKEGVTHEQYISTPNRRIFNQLLEGGEVSGPRDEGREQPVLWDVCRGFHPERAGMYTHWEQKINARPGNYGSRIDFVLCSLEMKSWFVESDIQEGLMGSDHCPVYAKINDEVELQGIKVNIKDIMNTSGTFKDGKRLKDYALKDIPAFSGKLLKEFDKRRSIKDMFSKKPASTHQQSSSTPVTAPEMVAETAPFAEISSDQPQSNEPDDVKAAEPRRPSITTPSASQSQASRTDSPEKKRKASETMPRPAKRSKSNGKPAVDNRSADKGQKSLKGFFASKTTPQKPSLNGKGPASTKPEAEATENGDGAEQAEQDADISAPASMPRIDEHTPTITTTSAPEPPPPPDAQASGPPSPEKLVDPIVSKESWSKVFTRPAAPKCEHGEPCKTMKTKKAGFNCGRDFWMCQRPLGPKGEKERGTQWRCPTFIWSSDWNGTLEQRT